MYKNVIKRMLDFTLSLLALILLSPVFMIVSLLVRIKLGSPVLFTQVRPGYHEKIFKMYKFRTMTDEKDEEGNLLPDGERLTSFGKLLRSTSLDELPELINIIKGDMSIVGPRPLLVKYLPYYNDEEHHRHDVRPGLTGLAQVSGRNFLKWENRFEKDIYYINNLSFVMDIKIIYLTIRNVLMRKDIADTSETFVVGFQDLDIERNKKEKQHI